MLVFGLPVLVKPSLSISCLVACLTSIRSPLPCEVEWGPLCSLKLINEVLEIEKIRKKNIEIEIEIEIEIRVKIEITSPIIHFNTLHKVKLT